MYTPYVSVIVPVYNAEQTIGLCIESLIAQDYPNPCYEIIIVDNNSTDKTARIIKTYPVKYLLQDKKQSRSATRNCGIYHATGDIIAFLDADCIAHSQWIRQGVKPFENKRVGACGGKILSYQPSSWIERYQDRQNIFDQRAGLSESRLLNKCAKIVTANAMYRKDALEKTGYFDESLISSEDTDLSYKVQRKTGYELMYNPDSIVYHKHRSSLPDLLRQNYRYGYSSLFMYQRYFPQVLDEIKHYGYLKPLYWALSRTICRCVKVCAGKAMCYLLSFKKVHITNIIDVFLHTVSSCADFYGQYRSSKDNRIPFCDLVVPDDKKGLG